MSFPLGPYFFQLFCIHSRLSWIFSYIPWDVQYCRKPEMCRRGQPLHPTTQQQGNARQTRRGFTSLCRDAWFPTFSPRFSPSLPFLPLAFQVFAKLPVKVVKRNASWINAPSCTKWSVSGSWEYVMVRTSMTMSNVNFSDCRPSRPSLFVHHFLRMKSIPWSKNTTHSFVHNN